ncbi:hypothetical protein Trisim1_012524 [Trichoderma cf. simile WF8]
MLALERRLREALTEDKISCASRPCDFPALTENETDGVFLSPHSNLHEATKEFDAIIAGPPHLTLRYANPPGQIPCLFRSASAGGRKAGRSFIFLILAWNGILLLYRKRRRKSHLLCIPVFVRHFDSSPFFFFSFDVERILRQASQESPGNNVKPRQASIDPFVASRVLGSCFHLAALVLAKREQNPPSPLFLIAHPLPPCILQNP